MFSHFTVVSVPRGRYDSGLTEEGVCKIPPAHSAGSFLFELQSGLRSHAHVQCFDFCMLPSFPRAGSGSHASLTSPETQGTSTLESVGGVLLVPKLLGFYEIS